MPFGKYSSVCVWAQTGTNAYKKWTTSSQLGVTAAGGTNTVPGTTSGVLDLATASGVTTTTTHPGLPEAGWSRIDLRAEDGFTIVELLTAMVIGAIVLVAALTVLDTTLSLTTTREHPRRHPPARPQRDGPDDPRPALAELRERAHERRHRRDLDERLAPSAAPPPASTSTPTSATAARRRPIAP